MRYIESWGRYTERQIVKEGIIIYRLRPIER